MRSTGLPIVFCLVLCTVQTVLSSSYETCADDRLKEIIRDVKKILKDKMNLDPKDPEYQMVNFIERCSENYHCRIPKTLDLIDKIFTLVLVFPDEDAAVLVPNLANCVMSRIDADLASRHDENEDAEEFFPNPALPGQIPGRVKNRKNTLIQIRERRDLEDVDPVVCYSNDCLKSCCYSHHGGQDNR